MRAVWTIARRELKAMFDHPTGYILLVVFIAVNDFLFFRQAYIAHAASLRPMLDLVSGYPRREIDPAQIQPSPFQPRKSFDEQGLKDLENSIREHGILQPVVVRRSGRGYELIAGERRWRAAKKAGLAAIPAVVAYNRFTNDIDRISIRFDSFVDEFLNILQRQVR